MKTILQVAGLLAAFNVLMMGCSGGETKQAGGILTSGDRTKFLGRWAGHYTCPKFQTTADTILIATGDGELDFSISIHTGLMNPDIVVGKLSGKQEITIPEQSMGGYPGTARISIGGDTLTYSQTGFGVTCTGSDYVRF